MTDQPDQELPPAYSQGGSSSERCCAAWWSPPSLVVLYYLLPLDRPLDTGTAVRLVIGALVFTGLAVWQVRASPACATRVCGRPRRWD